jgi:1-acyl-sn-glycerol-3-phosphate acyltransferase
MRTTLRSLFAWTGIALIVLTALPTMALARVFDRDPARYHTGRLFRWFGGLVTSLNPAWHLTVSGRMPENPRNPFVVVSNHQSFGDIPVICHLPWEMKWIVKEELFHTPVFGWLMRMAGDIGVDRRSAKSRAAVLPQARDYLDERCSVMFFPEGTRSRDGRVLRFAQGPFRLAVEAGVPVLPLAIEGTRGTLPKGGWRFDTDCHIRLKVLDPVSTDGLGPGDVEALHDEVRGRIVEQVAAWRGVAPHLVDARAPEPAPADAEASGEIPPGEDAHDSEKAVNTVPSEAKPSRKA